MLKLICLNFLLGTLLLCIPVYRTEYTPIIPPPKAPQAPTARVRVKQVYYTAPTGKALEISNKVAEATGYPQETIAKIMFAESAYNFDAVHKNNNATLDYGLFQINSIHLSKAKKMGLDITQPDDNADFAIYLINQSGLSPWNSSRHNWELGRVVFWSIMD